MNDLLLSLSSIFSWALGTFIFCFIAMPTLLFFLRLIGLYITVEEKRALVYVLFGKVELVISEPGFHLLIAELGWKALIINLLGSVIEVDLRLDQEYLRSTPVNSEEGAPMGIGIWYEMWINNPVAFLFKNADPRGSLRANVSNATVRNLSNLKLANMLTDRHNMSSMVRQDVEEKSREWGYALGSIYVRKVLFRDANMIQQIEEKVVNRLRQVTSAIVQDGTNQVNLITSTAERQAAVAFGQAAAMRPVIVGEALSTIAQDPEVAETMFQILENQKILEGGVDVTLIPSGLRGDLLTQILTSQDAGPTKVSAAPPLPRSAPRISDGVSGS